MRNKIFKKVHTLPPCRVGFRIAGDGGGGGQIRQEGVRCQLFT